jgi:hypothetical protein
MKTIASLLFCVASLAFAQDKPASPTMVADTSWKHSMIVSANITQIAFTNWVQGGENALAYALFLEGKSAYTKDVIEWVNMYKFGYGQARLGSLGIRKTDDKIVLESVLMYKIGTYINPFASASLKTQFAEGVMYDALGTATPVSNFFDPAYLIQTAGFGYQPVKEVKTRLGLGLREIVTNTYTTFYTDGKKVQVDAGLESVTEVGWTVMENIILNSKLEVYVPVKQFNQTTIISDNTISAKVNKYLSMNINVFLINDPKIQARTQVKQTLALGVNFTLI